MAKTITGMDLDKLGRRRVVYVRITLDSSYPTGGYPLTPSELGLQRFDHLSIEAEGVGSWGEYNFTTGKIVMFASNGTEVTAATNLSAVKLRCKVDGI